MNEQEANSTIQYVQSCKNELYAVLDRYAGFMAVGLLIGNNELQSAKDVCNDIVNDLFYDFIQAADDSLECMETKQRLNDIKDYHRSVL